MRERKLRILVIEDTPKHQESVFTTLEGHEVTLAKTVKEAVEILKSAHDARLFDAVLTDLFLPLGEYDGHLHVDIDHTAELPVGLVFAIRAKNLGVPYIGICTDKTRHNHPITTLLEILGSVWDDPQPGIIHSELRQCCTRDGAKDWGAVLVRCFKAKRQ